MADTDIHDIQEIGFRTEVTEGVATEGVAPFSASVLPIHFGEYTTSFGKFPQLIQEVAPSYKGGSYDAYIQRVIKTSIFSEIAYVPTNSLMWLYAYGQAVSGGSGIHSLSGINTGNTPSLAIRWETGNDPTYANNIRADALAMKLKRLSMAINFSTPNNVITESATFVGRRATYNTDPNDTFTDNNHRAPIYADGNPVDSQERYLYDNNFSCKWDDGNTDVELKTYLRDFTYIMDVNQQPRWIDGQKYPQWISTKNRAHGIAFQMIRSDESAIFDSFIGQRNVDIREDLSFLMYNGASNYRDYTFSEMTIQSCELNHAFSGRGEEPYYDIKMTAKSSVLDTKDGLTTVLYGY